MPIRIVVALIAVAFAGAAAAAPPRVSVGDTWTFEARNGYNERKDPFAIVRVEVTAVSDAEIATRVQNLTDGSTGVERFTRDWNPLSAEFAAAQPFAMAVGYREFIEHPLTALAPPPHALPANGGAANAVAQRFVFAPAYPEFPARLDPGVDWKGDAVSRDLTTGHQIKADVSGRVVGSARVKVPAGEFDAIELTRITYFADENFRHTPTRVTDTEWFVPALGRSVKYETRWDYFDKNADYPVMHSGDWTVYELASYVTR